MKGRELNYAARLCIQTRSARSVDDKAWMLKIQEAVLDGYRICENKTMRDSCMRNFNGSIGQCVLYKEGQEFLDQLDSEEVTEETAPEGSEDLPDEPEKTDTESSEEEEKDPEAIKVDFTRLGELTKKVDILEYLESLGIEVPENLKQPNAIKKWVKDNYQ